MTLVAQALSLRAATPPDIPALEALIARSARALSRAYYDADQIEAAIEHVFGVDSELVDDGSYFMAEWHGALAGCGGWSRRATLFGGDRFARRSSALLDPATDAARIRAFSSQSTRRDAASGGRCFLPANPRRRPQASAARR